MTDDTIQVMVQCMEDCAGHESWILVDEKGYIWAELNPDAVKANQLEHGATYEMKLIAP